MCDDGGNEMLRIMGPWCTFSICGDVEFKVRYGYLPSTFFVIVRIFILEHRRDMSLDLCEIFNLLVLDQKLSDLLIVIGLKLHFKIFYISLVVF